MIRATRFDLIPHTGANDIKLGMSREEVRKILGKPEYSAEKSTFEFQEISIPTPAKDGYFNNELQITFDDNGNADFIEFSGRGAGHVRVFLNGLDVFHTPAPDLIMAISRLTESGFDKEEEEIPYSYIFPDIDLGLWRQVLPQLDENENSIPEADDGKYFWTIGIGIQGYYQKD
jgi:hypothetical protein